MVKHANDVISPLASVYCFINEIINLYKVVSGNVHMYDGHVRYNHPTCLGTASQQTPKMAHLRGVRKYIGPGCCGSLG